MVNSLEFDLALLWLLAILHAESIYYFTIIGRKRWTYFHLRRIIPEELQIELFPEYKVQKQRQQGEWNYILSVIFRPLNYNNIKLNNAWLIQQSEVK